MKNSSTHTEEKDDLKLIQGIGPGIESRLHSSHIYTFAQLAALSPEDLASLLYGLTGLSTERISKQDWIGQARKLADEQTEQLLYETRESAVIAPATIHGEETKGGIQEESPSIENLIPQTHKHYVNFTVELWLDKDNDVRRTRVIHLQDHTQLAWSGWESQELINFIVEHAGLFQSMPNKLPADNPIETEFLLSDLKVTTMENPNPTHLLGSLQPFQVHLALDLSKIDAPPDTPLGYSAEVFAKDLSRGRHLMVGTEHGELLITEQATINIEGQPLQPGLYRLEAAVRLTQTPGSTSSSPLMAFLDGGGFQVY